MIGWLFGVGLRRPVAVKRRIYVRASRRFVRRHQGHGIRRRGALWWCPRCRLVHAPRTKTRWRLN